MLEGRLDGLRVLVAGAGLAGLAASRDLIAAGARVTVIDARDRVGGRVTTVRSPFLNGQHAEAGGDLIDDGHRCLRMLAAELGLTLSRILPGGFGFISADARGRTRILPKGVARGWMDLAHALAPLVSRYGLIEHLWDSPIAVDLARHSVADWLHAIGASDRLRETAAGLRGFFLADPGALSLLALVDQFAEDARPPGRLYRIDGGNDRLTCALAAPLGDRLHLQTELVAISCRGRGVRATVRQSRRTAQIQADVLLVALPAPVLRRIPISPALPPQQHDAIARLKYGEATKTLVQFPRRIWRAAGRPRAFASAQAFGAVWEANEEQRGRSGILSFLAGGSDSDRTREIVTSAGVDGLLRGVECLGLAGTAPLACSQTVWELDPWARGGYAYFDPEFDPRLRGWLARPTDRLFFAGEHTSIAWQGYMNGAVESGQRAAAEVAAAHRLARDG